MKRAMRKGMKTTGWAFCFFLMVFGGCCRSATREILEAKDSSDLGWYPEVKVFPRLLKEISDAPTRQKMDALFHYSSLIDAGASLCFYRDCFDLFCRENPFILCDAYMRDGDMRYLDLLKRVAVWYDPIAFGEDRSEKEIVRILRSGSRQIRRGMTKNRKGQEFIKFYEELSANIEDLRKEARR